MKVSVAALQMSLEWGNEKGNVMNSLEAIDSLLKESEIDIICLPELFSTGFNYKLFKQRDHSLTQEILSHLAERAKEKGVYIISGTLPENAGGKVYNTIYVIDPDGRWLYCYRKIHLFPLMQEDQYFSPGNTPLVFDSPWGKIGAVICYDIRFSGLFQAIALAGAQIIFIPAQFPSQRIDHWDALLKARAIENQLYIVGVNRLGEDPVGTFIGHTSIYDPLGQCIADGGEGEGWVIATLDLDQVKKVRQELPALFHYFGRQL